MKALYIAGREAGTGQNPTKRRITGIMSSPVTTIAQGKSLGLALSTMVYAGLRHLAVVDDDGKCRGVLSDRAIAAAWATDPACLSYLPVSSVVEPMPPLLREESTVLDAARMMRRYAIDAVVVVDAAGAPVGIVTGSDLVALLAA
jgi:CBS domain-containing protein